MKKLFYFLTSLAFMGTSSGYAATTQGTAVATVVKSLTISANSPISFGTFSAGTGGTVSSAGASTGDVDVMNAGNAGTFNVSGLSNATFTTTGDGEVVLSKGPGPDESMTAALTYPAGTTALDSSGNAVISVNGTLEVNNNQPTGDYEGAYNVTVNY